MTRLRQEATPGQAEPKPRRHKWGDKVVFPHKSERECIHGCGIVKVSRHEGRSHWIEYWRGLEKISVGATPACEAVKADA